MAGVNENGNFYRRESGSSHKSHVTTRPHAEKRSFCQGGKQPPIRPGCLGQVKGDELGVEPDWLFESGSLLVHSGAAGGMNS